MGALPRARFVLPQGHPRGFRGELPLKLLFVDDLGGAPATLPVEDQRTFRVTSSTVRGVQAKLLRADSAEVRARWDRMASLLASLEAAHAAIEVEVIDVSPADLQVDFEDAPTVEKSGLHRHLDLGIYNWPGLSARPPFSALFFGYDVDRDPLSRRMVTRLAESTCTPLGATGDGQVEDALRMAGDMERTGWSLDPHGPDPRAAWHAGWSLLRHLLMLQSANGSRQDGFVERMQAWLDAHAGPPGEGDGVRPLREATASLVGASEIRVVATLQAPPGAAKVRVAASTTLCRPV